MKAIIEDLILATLGLWLAEWFIPREDYEWLQRWALKVEGMARQDRENHERLIEQRADDIATIEDLRARLEAAECFVVEAWDRWGVDNELIGASLDKNAAERAAADYNENQQQLRKPGEATQDWQAEVKPVTFFKR